MLSLDWASILAPSPGWSGLPSNGGDYRVGVARTVSDPAAVLKGLGEPKRSEVQKLYHWSDLTILKVIWRECPLSALSGRAVMLRSCPLLALSCRAGHLPSCPLSGEN